MIVKWVIRKHNNHVKILQKLFDQVLFYWGYHEITDIKCNLFYVAPR